MGIPDAHFHTNIGTPMPNLREYGHPNANICGEYGHPAMSGTKLDILMPISTFTICKPHTDTAVNLDFHRLA